jgi:single-stranded DNA-binding protein
VAGRNAKRPWRGALAAMIRPLVSRARLADPETRVGASGKEYTTARIRSGGDDAVLVSVIGFRDEAEALARFAKGDAVSVSGTTTITSWLGRDGVERRGLKIVAEQVIGAKRKSNTSSDVRATRKPRRPHLACQSHPTTARRSPTTMSTTSGVEVSRERRSRYRRSARR